MGQAVTVLVVDPTREYHREIAAGETPVDADGGSLVVAADVMTTTELDFNKVLQPDGLGGVAWQAYDPVIEGDLDMQCNDLLHTGGIYFCDFGSSSGSGSSGETDLWIRPDYATGEQLEYHAEGGHRFESPVWLTGILTMSTVGAHVYLGANGIGNNAPILTFAVGATGKASLAGALDAAGRIGAPAGAVGAPGLSFSSQTDLGLYMIGVAEMGVTVGGVRQGSWTATGLSLTGLAMTGNINLATNSIENVNTLTVAGTTYIESGALHVGEADAETGWLYLYGAASPSIVGGVAVFYGAADYAVSYRIRVTEDDFEFCTGTTSQLTYQGATNTWLFSAAVDFGGNDLTDVGTMTVNALAVTGDLDMGCSDILYAQGLYFCDVGSSSGSGSSGLSDIWIRPDLNTAGQLEYHAEGGHRFESPVWFTGAVNMGANVIANAGNISMSSTSTVDGRDVSADGAILDAVPTTYLALAGGALVGNLFIGANGIGNNAAVLTFAVTGAGRATLGGGLTAAAPFLAASGSAAAPAYAFSGNSSYGFYIAGMDDELSISVGGTRIARWAGNGLRIETASSTGLLTLKSTHESGIGYIEIATSGTGNVFTQYTVVGTAWRTGIDNSDGDKYKIHNGALADTSLFELTTAGALTLTGGGLTIAGNLLVGASGIGNNGAVLTFAVGAAGAAALSGDLDVVGHVETDDAYYLGDPDTDGSWRIRRVDWDLVFEQLDSDGWGECDRMSGCASSSSP